MPARRERLYVVPQADGRPICQLDFPLWWDRQTLFQEYAARQVDTGNPFYVDYGLLLTPGEALVLDRQGRQAFANDPRAQLPGIQQAMQHLAENLKDASWVIVESYEWESGLS